MARDTFYPQLCKCNSCGHEQKFYIWTSQLERFSEKCVLCPEGIFVPFVEEKPEVPAILGLHIERNLNQRRKRNHEHFKKEVLPTITDSDTKKHFNKKLSIKL